MNSVDKLYEDISRIIKKQMESLEILIKYSDYARGQYTALEEMQELIGAAYDKVAEETIQ